MRKLLLLLFAILALSFASSDFTDGYSDGYCSGYKSIKGDFVVCPVTPVAPVPPVGKDTYRGGYDLGFVAGRNKAKNQ